MNKLIPLLLLCVSMPSLAQRQFDIEVIIFKRLTDPELVSESWPDSVTEIEFSRSGSMNDASYLSSKEVIVLPQSEFQLSEQEQKLDNHAGYEVLIHKAWRQGDEGRAASPVFHLKAGKDYSDTFNVDGSEKRTGSNTVTPLEGVQETTIAPPLRELEGTFQVYVQHYLYTEAKLDFKAPSTKEVIIETVTPSEPTVEQTEVALDTTDPEPVTLSPLEAISNDDTVIAGNMQAITPETEVQSFLKSYRFDQKRRMRSSETHYLDHPLMGIIIQVRRVEESETLSE
jgi:hypothetical protein